MATQGAGKKNIHPYIPGPGQLVQPFTQFRKVMPANIDASTLKRLSLAPNNEGMVLGALRFLGLIDEAGKRTEAGKEVFLKHDDAQFAKALEVQVKKAYAGFFEDRGENAWTADRDTLIAYFRTVDETSGLTAKRQAIAFETLAALSGHGQIATPRATATSGTKQNKTPAPKANAAQGGKITTPNPKAAGLKVVTRENGTSTTGEVALTVRIEVNLPAQGDQETYDRIFKSIRANLLNG